MEQKQIQATEEAFKMIRHFEGLRLKAYKPLPLERYFTIGYGHYGADVSKDDVITKADAEHLLHTDVAEIEIHLQTHYKNLTQIQFDALVSLIYNIGIPTFSHNLISEYMKDCNGRRSPLECACRIVKYCYAGGVKIRGLMQRRVVEANHFLGYKHFTIVGKKIIELPNKQ